MSSNSLERNAELRLKFEAKLHSYSSNSDLQWISFDLVDKCVRGMKLLSKTCSAC